MNRKINLLIDIPLMLVALILMSEQIFSIYIKKELVNSVQINTKSNYSLSIDRFQLHLFNRSVLAEGIVLTQFDNKTTSVKTNIRIGSINLSDLIWNRKINVGFVNLYNSVINIRAKKKTEKEISDSAKFTTYDLFKEKYSSFFAKEINIDNAAISFFRNAADTNFLFSTKDGAIRVRNFLIDSATTYIQQKPFAADSLDIFMKDIKNTIADSLYTLTIPTFLLSYASNMIFIDSLSIKPNYPRKEFFDKIGHQDDRFDVFVGRMLFDSIDVKHLLENFECDAVSINVDSLHLNVYRNKYYKSLQEDKLFLQEIIAKIDMPLKVKQLNVKHSYVQYEELNPPAEVPGKIFFTEIDASFHNLNNDSLAKDQSMTFAATAKFNGHSHLTTDVSFPLDKPFFSGNTFIKNIPMNQLNSMLETEAGVTITNGIIDSIKFSIQADRKIARGNVEMIYHDLRVTGKNVEKNDTSEISQKVKGFIANNFILKNSNPGKNGKIRREKMSRPYDNHRFIFNNLFKTLMQGVKKTIGA